MRPYIQVKLSRTRKSVCVSNLLLVWLVKLSGFIECKNESSANTITQAVCVLKLFSKKRDKLFVIHSDIIEHCIKPAVYYRQRWNCNSYWKNFKKLRDYYLTIYFLNSQVAVPQRWQYWLWIIKQAVYSQFVDNSTFNLCIHSKMLL